MPFILLGSIMSLISNLRGISWLSWIPFSSKINDFTFGLMGLMVVFLVPYLVLQKKKFESQATIGGFTALAAYLLLCMPSNTSSRK